ncbi:MAG TPA: YciI family protein [Candidatus Limnocylindria bacterium]
MTRSLFVLIHRPGPRWLADMPFPEQAGIMDHIGFLHQLDEDHRLILGGPFDDEWAGSTETTPVGIAIIEASGLDEAQRLAASDESVKAGLLIATVRPWRPRMGSALPAE